MRRLIKQVQTHAAPEELAASGAAVVAGLHDFEREVAANIQEDQRIIVVDAERVHSGAWWSIT